MQVTKQQQIVEQCRAVSALAAHLSKVHAELAELYGVALPAGVVEIVGQRTAWMMEELGNMLNEMDAVQDSDVAAINEVFDRAHAMFPNVQPNL